MTTALPSNVSYGQVIYRCMEAVADGSDADRYPDGIPIEGATITFTPRAGWWANATAVPTPVTIVPRPIVCRTDKDGYLVDPLKELGVYLVAVDPDLNPSGGVYQVRIEIAGVATRTFPIEVLPDQVIDLTLAQPVSGSAGNAVVVGPAGPATELSIGTVTTGAAGADAAAAITGTPPEQVLSLSLPRGADGAAGGAGPAGSPTAFELRGTGFPEGVVSAPVGTYYTDTAATSGVIRWVKATGAGSTGWRIMVGDTGWRTLVAWGTDGVLTSGSLPASWTVVSGKAGEVRVRRINESVRWAFRNVHSAGSAWPYPVGFAATNYALFSIVSAVVTQAAYVYVLGALYFPIADLGTNLAASQLDYVTDTAWPATLPGTPG